ncbi:MAG: hypothetical protein ERJ68_08070 [Aphanocapsa feldmannii 277cI]|uniref:Uncharacterized protein n=1 Tax=Aphanocapsa feldmannii 277cI TaxID=2507554 RepID=A0A524RS03_9CHRO|nr:MAG: hypothetical protein ERJ68_08070 [Aphanocapsa feldmannii 277cI]
MRYRKDCSISAAADREDRVADAVLIAGPHRTASQALWPWAAGAAMAFSGWLPVQAMPATPDSSQCTINSETVTCSGDLSDGVAVNNDESSTYTELIVNDLSSDIIQQ